MLNRTAGGILSRTIQTFQLLLAREVFPKSVIEQHSCLVIGRSYNAKI